MGSLREVFSTRGRRSLLCFFSPGWKELFCFLFWSRVWGFRSGTRQREVEKKVSFFVFRFPQKGRKKLFQKLSQNLSNVPNRAFFATLANFPLTLKLL